jgi:hypothetical protein
LRRDACVTQGELERSEALFVFPHTFGEEDLLGDHVLAQFGFLQENLIVSLLFGLRGKSNTAICEDCMKKERDMRIFPSGWTSQGIPSGTA